MYAAVNEGLRQLAILSNFYFYQILSVTFIIARDIVFGQIILFCIISVTPRPSLSLSYSGSLNFKNEGQCKLI
jgi:hypothetical protein